MGLEFLQLSFFDTDLHPPPFDVCGGVCVEGSRTGFSTDTQSPPSAGPTQGETPGARSVLNTHTYTQIHTQPG